MTEERRKFKRETAEARKAALIAATLELVAENGVRGATVRAIAERADVTQGLIRHYFSSKEELISAAYEHHMTYMTDLTEAPATQVTGCAVSRLSAFVVASLTPPVVDPRSIGLWASFLNKVQQDPVMRQIHAQTYADFRDRLEALIDAALRETGRSVAPPGLRHLAIACNAVIDGLWLEGGALPDAFEPGELPEIGVRSVGAITGLELKMTPQEKADRP
ncbi:MULTISPECIES: TetR/AcrR family transcriptional regulator [Rhodobacterales]|uniref:TetR family transcriptional regulator C-terminal domain-containing protein n=1 Tax=Phaeobacter gallaeciensis TaxID=60890 RepID=A0AAW6L170_9RHOB|nr:TetR family transcriptional regulator C-terminal domain-containing protein [Phaeobacter gallaeciensis]MDF1773673.1 TetR family transcriptional regulator C-terminal domain-containing protein [Pseudophaeobacter sp. bin_em_oilr2.035]MEE2634212.1 TetR family transcriptional regulator C-terminal domain-containing protein [Pseudomonadota bacterium]MDE4062675.1 TetR family transcriptional regulator C-terminal domain-containing protein [Phaeobacter gallaeciensis]MDE4097197.1 TetR family transcriptio